MVLLCSLLNSSFWALTMVMTRRREHTGVLREPRLGVAGLEWPECVCLGRGGIGELAHQICVSSSNRRRESRCLCPENISSSNS